MEIKAIFLHSIKCLTCVEKMKAIHLPRKFEWSILTRTRVSDKMFQSIDFFTFLLQSDNELLESEMPKSGVQRPRFRVKA